MYVYRKLWWYYAREQFAGSEWIYGGCSDEAAPYMIINIFSWFPWALWFSAATPRWNVWTGCRWILQTRSQFVPYQPLRALIMDKVLKCKTPSLSLNSLNPHSWLVQLKFNSITSIALTSLHVIYKTIENHSLINFSHIFFFFLLLFSRWVSFKLNSYN